MKVVKRILFLFIGVGIVLALNHKTILKMYYKIDYMSIVDENAEDNEVDKFLIYAIIKNESDFNKNAVSLRGAKGLMQIMPSTAKWINSKKEFGYKNEEDLFNENINIAMGTWYIKDLQDEFHDMEKAIVAYNAGRGNLAKWLKNEEYCSENRKLKYIPFKETDIYFKRVIFSYKMYKYLYN